MMRMMMRFVFAVAVAVVVVAAAGCPSEKPKAAPVGKIYERGFEGHVGGGMTYQIRNWYETDTVKTPAGAPVVARKGKKLVVVDIDARQGKQLAKLPAIPDTWLEIDGGEPVQLLKPDEFVLDKRGSLVFEVDEQALPLRMLVNRQAFMLGRASKTFQASDPDPRQ